MLEIFVTDEIAMIGFKGSTQEIATDCITTLHQIYEQMAEESEAGANAFKDVMLNCVELAFKDESEIDEELEKLDKESKKIRKRNKETEDKIAEVLMGASKIITEDGVDKAIDFLKNELEALEEDE